MTHRVARPAASVRPTDRNTVRRGFAERFSVGGNDMFADLLDRLDRIAALPVRFESRH
jgi:hypothetical protein